MIGEEFYAASAYLSRDPQVVSGIKAADWLKASLLGYFLALLSSELALRAGFAERFFKIFLEILKKPEKFLLGGP